MPGWEADLRYEINRIRALPHTVVYVEAGYSDANSPRYTARILNAIGVWRIRGFYTNDTHNNWTINEVRWATKISRRTHGAHFIVNTATNGRGPKLNRNRVRYGNEDLCNPPGRGLGPEDTTDTGFPFADAFLWTHPPGQQQRRLRWGPSVGGLLAGARDPARATRQRPARSRFRQPALLTAGGSARGRDAAAASTSARDLARRVGPRERGRGARHRRQATADRRAGRPPPAPVGERSARRRG